MEKYFRQIAGVFKAYKEMEMRLNSELEKAKSSGDYSSGYLNSMANSNLERLRETNQECMNTLAGIRAELEEELLKKNDLLSREISAKLKSLLDSGISLTLDEWRALALKSRYNAVESRMLHDRAAAQGITLENYIPTDSALKTIDRLISNVRDSMYGVNPITAPFKTVGDAEHDAGVCWGLCTEPSFDCYFTPRTLEEVARLGYEERLRDIRPTEAEGKDFEAGFGASINDGTLDEKDFIGEDEAEIREKIRTLKRSKESALRDLDERYDKGSYFHTEGKNRIERVFSKEIGELEEDIAELDREHEEETRRKLEAEKSLPKGAGTPADRKN